MKAIFQCLAEEASSLRSSPKHVVRKEGRNLQEQVLALLKLVHSAEGNVIHSMQSRHAVKNELLQFADNTQQGSYEFFQCYSYQDIKGVFHQFCRVNVVNTSLLRKKYLAVLGLHFQREV